MEAYYDKVKAGVELYALKTILNSTVSKDSIGGLMVRWKKAAEKMREFASDKSNYVSHNKLRSLEAKVYQLITLNGRGILHNFYLKNRRIINI